MGTGVYSAKKKDSDRLKRLHAEAEPWTEEMILKEFKTKPVRAFHADSYQRAADELLHWVTEPHGVNLRELEKQRLAIGNSGMHLSFFKLPHKTDIQKGWGFLSLPRTLPQYEPVFLPVCNRNKQIGSVTFTADIEIPRLIERDTCWMSYTFSEVLSQRTGVKAARGDVLIGGLGLGWFARTVVNKPGVKSVVIVERDPAVAEFFGAAFEKHYGDRVKVVVDDAFDYAYSQQPKFDSILMDIWPSYGNADDSRWLKLAAQCKGTKTRTWLWS